MPSSCRRTRRSPATWRPTAINGSARRTAAPEAVLAGVRAAAPILDAFIDEAIAEARALPKATLALVGFSQGTMMSLFVGLRRAEPVAGIVGYFGPADRARTAGERVALAPAGPAGARHRRPARALQLAGRRRKPRSKPPAFRSRPWPARASATRSTTRGCGAAALFLQRMLLNRGRRLDRIRRTGRNGCKTSPGSWRNPIPPRLRPGRPPCLRGRSASWSAARAPRRRARPRFSDRDRS